MSFPRTEYLAMIDAQVALNAATQKLAEKLIPVVQDQHGADPEFVSFVVIDPKDCNQIVLCGEYYSEQDEFGAVEHARIEFHKDVKIDEDSLVITLDQ